MGNISSLYHGSPSAFDSSTESSTLKNRKWVLAQHPKGKFKCSTDARLVEEKINLSDVTNDEVVIEVMALSVDAFIRGPLI